MMMRQRIFPWALIVLFLMTGMWIQSHVFLSFDVSYLLTAAEHLINGGTYEKNFFDVNPPMILFLYSLPVLVTKYLGINFIVPIRAITLLFAVISLILCDYLLNRLIETENKKKYVTVLLCSIAFVYIFFPVEQFAQREHFLILLTTPYVLLAGLRLQNKVVPFHTALTIGIFSGMGFAIKPYFLITFILIELFILLSTRRLFAWVRTEVIAIILVHIALLVTILLLTPTYLTSVLPYALHIYVYHGRRSWWFTLNYTHFTIFAMLIYLLSYQFVKNIILFRLLAITSVSYAFLYVFEAQAWYYHLIPLFSYCFLLLVLGFLESADAFFQKNKGTLLVASGTVIALFGILFSLHMIMQRTILMIEKKSDINQVFNQTVNFVKLHTPNKMIYSFSMHMWPTGLTTPYADVKIASRFPNFWMISGILAGKHPNSTPSQIKWSMRMEKLLRDAILQDFTAFQPDLVSVEADKYRLYLEPFRFDFLEFLNQDLRFRTIWSRYCFVKTIGTNAFYERCR